MYTLTELCRELSISPATGRNWIKLGKIKATGKKGNAYMFPDEYVEELRNELESGVRSSLKSRRNKGYVSGKFLCRDYISENSHNLPLAEKLTNILTSEPAPSQDESDVNSLSMTGRAIICDCIIRMIIRRTYREEEAAQIISECIVSPLFDYLNHDLSIGPYDALVDDFLLSPAGMHAFLLSQKELPFMDYVYEPGQDIAGLLYLSLKSLGHRKKSGAYYTPNSVVKKLLTHLYQAALMSDGQDKSIFDPCCGTGNFLLQLPPGIPKEHIWGADIDEDSAKLARISLALKYDSPDPAFWREHITISDFLIRSEDAPALSYDVILGNPPWGYAFSEGANSYIREHFESAGCENPESFDLFCEQAIKSLTPGGYLSFVLPESILTVRSHTPIREYLIRNSSLTHLEYLGEVFDRVQCPSIVMQLKKSDTKPEAVTDPSASFLKEKPRIYEKDRNFTISEVRSVNPENFDFLMPEDEYSLLRKLETLPGALFLEDNSDFALGIVTGNNKEMLQSRKTAKNEIILKGQDIFRYRFREPKCFINYRPELCQQTAPLRVYRAPEKLLYRFIGGRLIFAYDNRQTLSLNSCNIVIPQLEGYDIRYILAVLNSRVLDYYFRKRFRSVKVLRSHIEKLPIPPADIITQNRIVALADRLIKGDPRSDEIYNLADRQIAELYDLKTDEYNMISDYLSGDNKSLLY